MYMTAEGSEVVAVLVRQACLSLVQVVDCGQACVHSAPHVRGPMLPGDEGLSVGLARTLKADHAAGITSFGLGCSGLVEC